MTKKLLVLLGLIPMLGFCAGISLVQTGPSATETLISGQVAELLDSKDSQGIYQPWTVVPVVAATTTVVPSGDYVIYKLNVATNNTAVAIDVSGLALANQYATFEVEVTVSDADFSFTLPGTNVVTYLDGPPDITTTIDGTKHHLVFRAMATNDIICNLWWTQIP